MKKIIIIIFICFVILITAGVSYLNQVYLPKTIKALIIKGIEGQTNTRVSLGSVRVNIFKGLVLSDLTLSYNQATIINVKEASCIFLPWAILQKKIIIPNISLKSAQLFIERKKDSTFNLQELFFIDPPVKADPLSYVSAASVNTNPSTTTTNLSAKGFSVSVYRIRLHNSRIIFRDDTFSDAFVKSIDNLDLVAHLTLPASLKFKFSGQVQSNPLLKFTGFGEFKVPEKELNTKIAITNISPKDFAVYYKGTGLNITEGLLQALINLTLKDNGLNCNYELSVKDLSVQKEKVFVRANLNAKADLSYGFSDNKFKHSGSVAISQTDVSGLDIIDKINNINTQITFDDAGLSTDKLTASIFGLPIEAKLKLSNFSDPILSLNVITSSSLVSLQGLLRDKYKLIIPGAFSGNVNLAISANGKLAESDKLNIIGYLDFINAALKVDKLDSSIKNINGRIAFNKDQAQWKDLDFSFQDLAYKTTGTLTNFKSPLLEIGLDSKDFNINSSFTTSGKLINITKCSGHYLSSEFSLNGNIDTTSTPELLLDLSGDLFVDLNDLRKPLSKITDQLDKINPQGKVHVQFNLLGKSSDLKNCVIEAKVSSENISLYGFKGKDITLSYIQKDQIVNIPLAQFSLYNGVINAVFKLNMQSNNYPYWFSFNMQGVDIKELKLDTPAKDKDIAGIIEGEFKASGFLGDITSSEGLGKISITKGKLWGLDLFKGLGKLLFTQDFTNIVFYEGSCAFNMRDKYISTDNLFMKSNIVDLSGPVRIGFDNSINASLNVDMIGELNVATEVIPSNTLKDVTKAILGETNKFAVIKISGTLKEPKYKFQAEVGNILKGLSSIIFSKNGG